jgi:hypothetical protein
MILVPLLLWRNAWGTLCVTKYDFETQSYRTFLKPNIQQHKMTFEHSDQ